MEGCTVDVCTGSHPARIVPEIRVSEFERGIPERGLDPIIAAPEPVGDAIQIPRR